MGCIVGVVWIVALLVAGVSFSAGGWGVAVGVAALGGAALVHRFLKSASSPDGIADGDSTGSVQVESGSSSTRETDLVPVEDVLRGRSLTRLGGQGRLGVAGEYYHQPAIRHITGRKMLPPAGQWEGGLRMLGALSPEPSNPHDPNAVRVYLIGGGETAAHVGYLPAEVAARWQGPLLALESRGQVGSCSALVYEGNNGTPVSVLHLSDPDEAFMQNSVPEEAELLEAVRQCAVVGEGNHQDVLEHLDVGPYWASLHPAAVPSGKSAGQATVGVCINGQVVGTLSAAQGTRYAALLDGDRPVACEALVFQGPRYREVRLMLPKVD